MCDESLIPAILNLQSPMCKAGKNVIFLYIHADVGMSGNHPTEVPAEIATSVPTGNKIALCSEVSETFVTN